MSLRAIWWRIEWVLSEVTGPFRFAWRIAHRWWVRCKWKWAKRRLLCGLEAVKSKEKAMMDKTVTTQEVLVGRYDLKLGKDRRLTIPDEWMPYFGESGRIVVVPDPHERCIDIVPADLMEKELDRLRTEAKKDAGLSDALRVIGSAAEQLGLDRYSIRISDKLLEYAGIEDRVALLGVVRMIQVWNPDTLGPDEPFDAEKLASDIAKDGSIARRPCTMT